MNLSQIIHYMRQGSLRRHAILTYLCENPESRIFVNKKHCVQLHQDNDLSYLLKKGKLKRERGYTYSNRCSYTSLVLA